MGLPALAGDGADRGRPVTVPDGNRLDRERALRLWTQAAGWFSNENGVRGTLKAGQLADLVVLTEDYFAVPEGRIPAIESALTLVGGRVVYATAPFGGHSPPPPIRPD